MNKTAEIFESNIEDFHNNLWKSHIPIPEEIAEKFIAQSQKRVLCQIANMEPFHAALMKSKEYWFVLLNAELLKKTGLSEGDKLKVSLSPDLSEYGREMPEELQVLLDQDVQGRKHFESLTKGNQRSLVYIVSKVKSSHSRLNKALAIISHLNEQNGELDFKKLNEKIKYYNNLGI